MPADAAPPDAQVVVTDADLILGSIDDVERFGELYDRHVEAVLAFHFRRVRCAATAADLTAETFASAFTSRHRFRDTGAPARAWLFTIARRQLAHFQRRERVADRARRRLGVDLATSLDDADVERIEALADLAPLRADLVHALDSLPAGQAAAVRLRVAEDRPYPEVARRLGCSEEAARARVSRGIARLTAQMGGRP